MVEVTISSSSIIGLLEQCATLWEEKVKLQKKIVGLEEEINGLGSALELWEEHCECDWDSFPCTDDGCNLTKCKEGETNETL